MFARSKGELFEQAPLYRQESVPAVQGLFVKRLQVSSFRNYASIRLDLPEKQIVLTGRNGIGKTNLMEAVSFLAPGKGLRQAKFSEVVPVSGGNSWTVAAVIKKGDEEIEIGTAYEPESAKRSEKRRIHLNGAPIKSQNDLGEVCAAVWLTPSMDRLFSGDPAGRRRFWDRLVQAFDASHAGNCAAYTQALRQWSSLLRDRQFDDHWLTALEKTMAKYGAKAAQARRNLLEKLEKYLAFPSPNFPQAALSMQGGMETELVGKNEAEAADLISSYFRKSRSLCAQMGAVGGVHTIDLAAVHTEKKMPAAACSTGEQKALLVSIMLAHINALAEQKGTLPFVLFDEAAAHLDTGRLDALLGRLKELKTQVWLTGTDPADFKAVADTAYFVDVENLLSGKPAMAAAS